MPQNNYCFNPKTLSTEVLVNSQPNLKLCTVRWQSAGVKTKTVFELSSVEMAGALEADYLESKYSLDEHSNTVIH